MKTAERIAIIYGASVLAAASLSWWRGRRGSELVTDIALHGGLAGTGLNVIAWLILEDGTTAPVFEMAQQNVSERLSEGMGKLTAKGLATLSQLDVDSLYQDMKKNGVRVAPVPANPSIIHQDHE